MGEQVPRHSRARRSGSVLLVAVGVLLLGVVAWSAGRADVEGGASADVGSPVGESTRDDLALVMIGAAGMVVVIALVPFVFRWSDRRRGERAAESPVRWRLVVATLLVGFLVLYAMLLLTRNDEVEPDPPAAPPPVAQDDDIQVSESEGASGWTAIALIATGAVVVLIGAAVARHRMRGARPEVDGAHSPVALEELSPLELEQLEPSEAVRLAYAGALRRLGTVGAGRRDAETPREHLARVHSLAPDAVEALSVLVARYEIVRFSRHPITVEMKDDAVRSYRSLASTVDEMTSVDEVMAP